MSRNEQKEMVHLCRSLTLSNAPKEIKLMGLYPIVLAVRCLLLLWAFCESPCIKGLTNLHMGRHAIIFHAISNATSYKMHLEFNFSTQLKRNLQLYCHYEWTPLAAT